MNNLQVYGIVIYGTISLLIFIKGFFESAKKKNPFGETPFLSWAGVFVWGDAVIFGLFWFLSSLVCYFLKDWILFLLIISVFWVVRSLGETIYWLNQQFSAINRNPPEKLLGYRFFKNDSIWFVYQIFWQCITVVSIISTIYLASSWMKNIS